MEGAFAQTHQIFSPSRQGLRAFHRNVSTLKRHGILGVSTRSLKRRGSVTRCSYANPWFNLSPVNILIAQQGDVTRQIFLGAIGIIIMTFVSVAMVGIAARQKYDEVRSDVLFIYTVTAITAAVSCDTSADVFVLVVIFSFFHILPHIVGGGIPKPRWGS